jgi:hypothetical protein
MRPVTQLGRFRFLGVVHAAIRFSLGSVGGESGGTMPVPQNRAPERQRF